MALSRRQRQPGAKAEPQHKGPQRDADDEISIHALGSRVAGAPRRERPADDRSRDRAEAQHALRALVASMSSPAVLVRMRQKRDGGTCGGSAIFLLAAFSRSYAAGCRMPMRMQ
jgi:hypothetical protein